MSANQNETIPECDAPSARFESPTEGRGKWIDMHRTTVDNCLKRAGVKQLRRPVLTDAHLDQAEAAYLAGDSWVTIAQRFGVDPGTVGRGLR